MASSGTYEALHCKGHPCARCGKCSDWYFTGDAATLEWIRSTKHWSKNEWTRWTNDGVYWRFKRRDGATCAYGCFGGNGHYDAHLPEGGNGPDSCLC